MNVGRLLSYTQKIRYGNLTGVCVVCGEKTKKGLKTSFSNNFMGYNTFLSGNVICPCCNILFSNQKFRRKSWVASERDFKIFKNDEAKDILFSPPDPPFYIHIAKIGQKQTWLYCMHRVSASRERYFFSHENYDVPILFESQKANYYYKLILNALEKGITKFELLSGVFRFKTYEKAIKEGWLYFLKELQNQKGILWEVMIDVTRGNGEKTNSMSCKNL